MVGGSLRIGRTGRFSFLRMIMNGTQIWGQLLSLPSLCFYVWQLVLFLRPYLAWFVWSFSSCCPNLTSSFTGVTMPGRLLAIPGLMLFGSIWVLTVHQYLVSMLGIMNGTYKEMPFSSLFPPVLPHSPQTRRQHRIFSLKSDQLCVFPHTTSTSLMQNQVRQAQSCHYFFIRQRMQSQEMSRNKRGSNSS